MANVQSSLPTTQSLMQKFQTDNLQYGYNGKANPGPNANIPLSTQQQTDIGKQNTFQQSLIKPAATVAQPASPVTSSPAYTPPNNAAGSVFKGFTGIGAGTSGAASNTPLYQDWLTQQANKSTPAQPSISGLQNIAQNQSPEMNKATQNVKGLQQVQSEIASNPNIASEVASGRGQAMTGQIQAGETALQNALAGQSQQIAAGQSAGALGLQGQQQQIGAQEAGAGLGLTQQGQQISGLQGAAGLAQPASQFGVLTNIMNGQPISGGTPQQASFAGGRAQGAIGQGSSYQNNLGSIAQGQSQANALGSLLTQNGVNPSDIPAANAAYRAWANLAKSDPRYQSLHNILNGINEAYSKVLGQAIDVESLIGQQNGDMMKVINDLNARAIAANEQLKNQGTGQTSTNSNDPEGLGI